MAAVNFETNIAAEMNEPLEETISRWDDPARAEDTLGRSQFAERICRALGQWKSHESLVVAIYGPWGSGKTWLLDRIAKQIEHQSDVRVCRFTPWLFESDEQILTEFFAMVLTELEKKPGNSDSAKLRVALWRNLARTATIGKIGAPFVASLLGADPAVIAALGPMADLLAIGENAATAASTPQTASQQRAKLTELFGASDAPRILVTIDDLDRLEDSQIRMIFRLIKTTANFPNLNYLVLGERKQLASALNEVASGDGDRYLEKIVQIPLTLPRASVSEIRGRLEAGIQKIAGTCRYDLTRHRERFDELWRCFRSKLNTYRSVHRILATLSFHAETLTKNGSIEVDLLDLLAIDFLRIFAPTTYEKISTSPIDFEFLVFGNRHTSAGEGNQKVDSPTSMELIETSELGSACALHLLCILFKGFKDTVPVFSRKMWSYCINSEKYLLSSHDNPVWNERTQHLYFEISPNSLKLSSALYAEFWSLSDPVDLAEFIRKGDDLGWRSELLNRLYEDVDQIKENAGNLLSALSFVSDDVQDSGNVLSREFHRISRLCIELIEKISESNRIDLMRSLISESPGISIPLLFIELLRGRCGNAYFRGIEASRSVPVLSREEIEGLTDSLMPRVKVKFFSREFPVGATEIDRLYRLAHAIGPDRFDEILRHDIEANGLEAAWVVAISAISGLVAPLRMDLFDRESLIPPASRNVVETLLQFAPAAFWRQFHDSASQATNLTEAETTVLAHIASGLREVEAGSPSNQGDNRQKGRKTKRSLAKNRKTKSTAPGSEQS